MEIEPEKNETTERLEADLEKVQGELERAQDPGMEKSTDRPEWLPEKFESPEAMAKAYEELQGKLGGEAEAEAPAEPSTDYGEYQQFVQEFHEKGELSEESYKELVETRKIPKVMVDEYLELGRKQAEVAQQAAQDKVLEGIGGRAKFDEMAGWARGSLSDDQLTSLNAGLGSTDENVVRLALDRLSDMHKAASKTKLIQGDTAKPESKGKAFASATELHEAMAKRDAQGRILYDTSPTYRREVMSRISKSNF